MTNIRADNLAALFRQAAQKYDTRVAFATRLKTRLWRPTSYGDVYESGVALGTALIDLGVKSREHVGLLADNRLEWIIADCAVQASGAADVPRGTDVTDQDIRYILNHADVVVCFVENLALWRKINAIRQDLKGVRAWILMDPEESPTDDLIHMNALIEKGRAMRAAGDRQVEERMDAIRPDDLCTLIYTSGTTGEPKGVMIRHSNLLYMVDKIPIDIGPQDRSLSILPVWHIFERALEVFTLTRGAATYYSGIRYLADDLKNVQPTFMGSAPRLWESLYLRFLDTAQKAHPVRRFLFHTGYGIAEIYKGSLNFVRRRVLRETKHAFPLYVLGSFFHLIRLALILPLYGFFNTAVLERLRQAVGGSLKATISGGGALPRHVDEFFNNIGLPVLEGYGMTETAAVISARTIDQLIVGTVGPVLSGVDLRVVDLGSGEVLYPAPDKPNGGRGLKGEIHVRGPQVMAGYYKNDAATTAAIKDGWLNTGDIGMITFNDCLKILGRSKDTIVLAGGENVEPVPIENRLLQSPLIENLMIVGQDEKHMAALVVPSLDGFRAAGIDEPSIAALAQRSDVAERIGKVIKEEISGDNGFKAFERVPAFRIVPKSFEVGNELTNLFKLKRHVITEKYKNLIDSIYGRS